MANTRYIGVNHDLRCVDGKYIQMPVWFSGEASADLWGKLAFPNPHARSGVGDVAQLYPHGTKFVDGERTFYYGYMNEVYSAKSGIGIMNKKESATGTTANITWGSVSSVAGDTVVGLVTTGFDDATPDEDDFAGGWLIPAAAPWAAYRVLKSTTALLARVSGEVDLTLDYGIAAAVTAGSNYGWLNFSEWKSLVEGWTAAYGRYMPFNGVSLIVPTASTWQWIQSWGPCSVIPYNEEMGTEINEILAVWHEDGTIEKLYGRTASEQIAGYILNSAGVAGTSTWLIYLMCKS